MGFTMDFPWFITVDGCCHHQAAIIKGTLTWIDRNATQSAAELALWRSGGFLRATSILVDTDQLTTLMINQLVDKLRSKK